MDLREVFRARHEVGTGRHIFAPSEIVARRRRFGRRRRMSTTVDSGVSPIDRARAVCQGELVLVRLRQRSRRPQPGERSRNNWKQRRDPRVRSLTPSMAAGAVRPAPRYFAGWDRRLQRADPLRRGIAAVAS